MPLMLPMPLTNSALIRCGCSPWKEPTDHRLGVRPRSAPDRPMTASTPRPPCSVAVIGGGPAGLMAAEVLAQAGVQVDLYDAMPSVGRKFLLAGVGGMNITHSEAKPAFLGRYRERQDEITALLAEFDAETLRAW